MHWSVLASVTVLALLSLSSALFAAIVTTSYLTVILIHELGHAFAARKLGYEVEAIFIGLVHGRCEFEAPEIEEHDVLIACAGSAAQLAVGLPALVIAALLKRHDFGLAAAAFVFLGRTNVILALLNLMPVRGMDGYTAWRVIPLWRDHWRARRATARALNTLKRRK